MNNDHNCPRAAIVIVAYNDEAHIEQAIRSACEQTEKNIEIICVDDGSTDSTYERICQCAARDERIKPVTQANNGTFGARYSGLQRVTSEYVLFLDSDDKLMPEAVETACSIADETGADVLEFGTILVKDENNPPAKETWTFLEHYFSQEKPLPKTDHGPELVKACFVEQAITWNNWNKCRRTELLRKAFQFYQGERVGKEEDMLLNLMVLCQAKRYVRIPTKLYTYTVGSGPSTTTKKIRSAVTLKNVAAEGLTLKLAREWFNKLGCSQDEAISGMDALTTSIRNCIKNNMLYRVAEEKRGEYLELLAQYCERNEYYNLISEAISRQQEHIALLEEQSRGFNEIAEMRQARIETLEAQNRDLTETVEARQAHIAQLEAQNRGLAGTAEARQARIGQLEVQNRGLTETAEARQARIEQLEAQNRYLSESFDTISNAFFWKITKPARFTLDVMKWAARPHAEKGLMRKGLYSLKANGPRITWQKAMQKIYYEDSLAHVAKQALFTEEELAQQRKRRFSKDVKFSIVVPLYNTPECFLRAMIESVQAQTYAGWELCMADGSDARHGEVSRICREYVRRDKRIRYRKLEKNLGISGNTNACLEMATGDYIGLFDHDDLLHPAALFEVMRTIENTGADFIYTDESTFHETPEDAYLPHFKPDFAPDNLRANNYICHFTVFKRALLDETGFFDPACDGSQDHDMVLRLTEKARRVAHIPEILYYWRAHAGSVAESAGVKPYTIEAGVRAVKKQLEQLGLEGQVEPVGPGLTIYRTRYAIKGTPKISILIPNYEHIEELRNCLDSIFDKTTWPNYELVIVENNSRSQELFHYYERVQQEHANVRVVTWEGTFNYSAVNNYGAQFCTGEYLLLLNNDIEVITPDWIQEMLMFAQRPDVGAVGAKLYYPDKTIQHAGVCLGMGGVAGHYFQHVDYKNVGYVGRLLYPQDMTAVTAACMLLRREVWEKLGGLDEDWAVAFNDVDLCMRIRKAGYLIVWTPFAELYHLESKSRGIEDTPEKQVRFNQEARQFQTRWAKELEAGDPYYNPNFSLARSDFFADNIRQHDAR